jgi:hypothetical protein
VTPGIFHHFCYYIVLTIEPRDCKGCSLQISVHLCGIFLCKQFLYLEESFSQAFFPGCVFFKDILAQFPDYTNNLGKWARWEEENFFLLLFSFILNVVAYWGGVGLQTKKNSLHVFNELFINAMFVSEFLAALFHASFSPMVLLHFPYKQLHSLILREVEV